MSLVTISFYALLLLFGPCRLSEFTLAGPHWFDWDQVGGWFTGIFKKKQQRTYYRCTVCKSPAHDKIETKKIMVKAIMYTVVLYIYSNGKC